MEKIALEEHFSLPDFTQYSVGGATGATGLSDTTSADLKRCLEDFGDVRLQAMDQGGITKSILSHTVPGLEVASSSKQAVVDAKKINDHLAIQIQRHPSRLGGFATLPLVAPNEAADEMERAVQELGFCGAFVNGQTHGHYLDEDRYGVFWERLVDLNVPVYLHPANAWQMPQNYQDHPELTGALWGWTPETATHVLRIIFAGVFDRYPGAQLIIGHGGETLPYLAWRLDSRTKFLSFESMKLSNLPSSYLRENISVTTSGLFSTPALRCAIESIGEDRVLFSVDYPFESSKEAGDWFDGLDLPPATLTKIATENARRLLRL